MSTGTPKALRLAIANDYPIVVSGLASMLVAYPARIRLVELAVLQEVASDVDVILYDTFALAQDLSTFIADNPAKVIIFSFDTSPTAVRLGLAQGAAGYLFKGLSDLRIVAAIERVHAGEIVTDLKADASERATLGDWPGRIDGLSDREAEILALVCQGLSNQTIADMTYLSINSVKTYIRSAYRKIGAKSRSQAVIWGIHHGFSPQPLRILAGQG